MKSGTSYLYRSATIGSTRVARRAETSSRCERNECEEPGGHAKGQQVVRLDCEEKAAIRRVSASAAMMPRDKPTRTRRPPSAALLQNVTRHRAKRHTDADFVGALSDGVGHYTINADR